METTPRELCILTSDQEDMFSLARLYEIGRRKPTDDGVIEDAK